MNAPQCPHSDYEGYFTMHNPTTVMPRSPDDWFERPAAHSEMYIDFMPYEFDTDRVPKGPGRNENEALTHQMIERPVSDPHNLEKSPRSGAVCSAAAYFACRYVGCDKHYQRPEHLKRHEQT